MSAATDTLILLAKGDPDFAKVINSVRSSRFSHYFVVDVRRNEEIKSDLAREIVLYHWLY